MNALTRISFNPPFPQSHFIYIYMCTRHHDWRTDWRFSLFRTYESTHKWLLDLLLSQIRTDKQEKRRAPELADPWSVFYMLHFCKKRTCLQAVPEEACMVSSVVTRLSLLRANLAWVMSMSEWNSPAMTLETSCISISAMVNALISSRTLLSHLLVLPPGDVLPPGFLDGPGERVKLPLAHLLQQKELRTRE